VIDITVSQHDVLPEETKMTVLLYRWGLRFNPKLPVAWGIPALGWRELVVLLEDPQEKEYPSRMLVAGYSIDSTRLRLRLSTRRRGIDLTLAIY
jgi:hypothetical protein